MRPRTIAMFATLLICIITSALFFHHQHSEHLMAVSHGAMSKEVKESFLEKGVDCMEVYEIQGYEGPETIFRMFALSQHEYSQLNPGVGLFLKQGDIICVKGIFGVTNTDAFAWFWPLIAAGCAAVGFMASMLVSYLKTKAEEKKQQQRKAHAQDTTEGVSSAVAVEIAADHAGPSTSSQQAEAA